MCSTASELTAVGTVVTSAVSFKALYAGAYHTCGLTADGDAYCWGANYNGQLGQFSTTYSAVPLKVIGQL